MKLADLTRDIRINMFLELVVFSKLGLSEFHNSSAEKNIDLDPDVFLQSRACMSFIRALQKKTCF